MTDPRSLRRLTSIEAGSAGTPVEVIHLDMDAFFASVEVLEAPELAGLPVVVGGVGLRGVVASASYAARRFGVRSAMPMAEARRRCPGIIALPARHGRYGEVSEELMELLQAVTPLVEPVALDEAYLDVSGAHRLLGSSEEIAAELRQRVKERLRLDCSVGVGRTKLVAKLASKAAKPRSAGDGDPGGAGVVVVTSAEEEGFLAGRPVQALPGVGPRSAERLRGYGIRTITDVRRLGRQRLVRLLGSSHGALVHALACGSDPRLVVPDRPLRSIGHEETFERDDRDLSSLQSKAKAMATSVTARCRRAGLFGRTVGIKVRFGDFTTVTRARTLAKPATTAVEIGQIAGELLAGLEVHRGVRLLGVQVSLLATTDLPGAQLELFKADAGAAVALEASSRRERSEGLEVAAEDIRRRYGSEAIGSLAAAARRSGGGRQTHGGGSAHCPGEGPARQ